MSRSAPHQTCQALTNEEHHVLFALLGNRAVAQAVAVVQIYSTYEPQYNSWTKMGAGVAVFLRDPDRKGYFIQVYDIIMGEIIFELEVYREFEYHSDVAFFHQFEAEDGVIGFNFSDEADAMGFNNAVMTLLNTRRKKREEKQKKTIEVQSAKLTSGQPPRLSQPHPPQKHVDKLQQQQQQNLNKDKKERKKFMGIGTWREKKRPVRKNIVISNPFNFEHVKHAGRDGSFNVDDELVGLFDAVGLNQEKLANPKTREFVYDYLEKHGKLEEAREYSRKYSTKHSAPTYVENVGSAPVQQHPHLSSAPPPPPPNRNKPPPPPPDRNKPVPPHTDSSTPSPPKYPPPPPSRGSAPKPPPQLPNNARPCSQYTVPPPPPLNPPRPSKRPPMSLPGPQSHSIPPPPPPLHSGAPPPPPPPPPPPFSSTNVPLPPPPPPMGGGAGGPPPPPPPPPAASNPRSALLDQIRDGKNLKKAQAGSSGPPPPPASGRNQLLDEIRNRDFKLHHVDDSDSRSSGGSEVAGLDGIALDLHKALQERAQWIQSDDDEDNDSDEDDDDEWDDDD